MRVGTLFIFISIILCLFLWVSLSGFLFSIGACLFAIFLVATVGYPDTALLFFLGAREARSSNEKKFYEAAAQEAYKLAVRIPDLYYYNGNFDRGFVFQSRDSVSIVRSKSLLETCNSDELSAICFELLLQVKKSMASKRTKVMFLLGFFSWFTHSLLGLFLELIPVKDVRRSADWLLIYLLHPVMELLFAIILGKSYFSKLKTLLQEYPYEWELLNRVNLKLKRPYVLESLPSRKLMELSAASRKGHYKNILAMEFLPHEWNYFFQGEEMIHVKKV